MTERLITSSINIVMVLIMSTVWSYSGTFLGYLGHSKIKQKVKGKEERGKRKGKCPNVLS